MNSVLNAENITLLLQGAALSLGIALAALVIGLLLATITAAARVSNNKILKTIFTIYVEIIRGTPMLLQIYLLFMGLPYLYQTISGNYLAVSPLIMGVIAVGINSGAYLSEIFRAAINSVDKGQWEAGQSLGLSYNKILKKIILPQAFTKIIPPLVNEFIVLIKDSSLLSVIGVVDLMKSSNIITSNTYDLFTPLIGAAVLYLCMTCTISFFANKLERKLKASD
ncbi:MAG: amino acid ABC transporter permease [Erysipelotrichaceae bacterium]